MVAAGAERLYRPAGRATAARVSIVPMIQPQHCVATLSVMWQRLVEVLVLRRFASTSWDDPDEVAVTAL